LTTVVTLHFLFRKDGLLNDKAVFFVSDTAFSRPLPTSAQCVESLFLYLYYIQSNWNTEIKKTTSCRWVQSAINAVYLYSLSY